MTILFKNPQKFPHILWTFDKKISILVMLVFFVLSGLSETIYEKTWTGQTKR